MTNMDRTGLHTPQDNLPLNPSVSPTPETDENEDAEALFANNPAGTAYIDVSDVDTLNENTQTDMYEAEPNNMQDDRDDTYDMLVERELRAGETDDVMESVEEGLTYVLPIDPPQSLDPNNDTQLDLDPEFGDDDITAQVRDALRRDAQTIGLVDRVRVAVVNGVVIVRGEVDDLDDTDNLVAVISDVPGVEAVRDETTVRGL